MFHHQDVARHQMRPGDARELIVGKVPGLDAKDHADRAALHVSFAEGGLEFDVGEETLGVLRIIGQNVGAELHFSLWPH